jgi:hypothetical protein
MSPPNKFVWRSCLQLRSSVGCCRRWGRSWGNPALATIVHDRRVRLNRAASECRARVQIPRAARFRNRCDDIRADADHARRTGPAGCACLDPGRPLSGIQAMPARRASYEFTIRRNPGGCWLAEESHGSLGGIFVSREAAARFALRETDGDADRVHSNRFQRLWRISRRSAASTPPCSST